jgi:ATP-binding cassette subfamily F protein uup
MALLGIRDVNVAFGGPAVLAKANFSIERGERLCLLGRNGAGKSTLMKLLDGTMKPDSGEIVRERTTTVARLEQDIPENVNGTIFDVAAEGLGEAGKLLTKYFDASRRVGIDGNEAALREMDRLHHALDAANAWQLQTGVETVLSHLGLDADMPFSALSGGRKRQTLLARALVRQPDVLLLDEPTNHLDVEAIEWMEDYLIGRNATLLFVTHDRAFLRRVATRIVELDRGALVDWGTDYDGYLERKDASLESEARQNALFDKKLAQEEVWIRTGIKARRTRNEGRVRALEALREERGRRRERQGTVRMQVQEAEKSGRMVVEVKDLNFSYGDRPIVTDLTTTIARGDRVGFIGPNGAGKTTLLRLLLGELPPDSGTVKQGTNLEIAYFDQLREQLDPDRTVFESIADGADFVEIGTVRKHVYGYLSDFLFTPDRARTPVRALSGGERNRLLLARLFTRSFNLLVMDEPTNDLDIETLDLLEERLLEYTGTLLLVSHDRAFLDNVVTSTLVMEGGGIVGEYAGGYTDWLRQKANAAAAVAGPKAVTPPPSNGAKSAPKSAKKKLSFKEQQELAGLPDRIEGLEEERDALFASLADPAFVKQGKQAAAATARVSAIEAELAAATARWEQLESAANA